LGVTLLFSPCPPKNNTGIDIRSNGRKYYVIHPTFVKQMGWNNKTPALQPAYDSVTGGIAKPNVVVKETCPTCGTVLTSRLCAPYCSKCNKINMCDSYTGKPTDKWVTAI